jgi:hypothetical protein
VREASVAPDPTFAPSRLCASRTRAGPATLTSLRDRQAHLERLGVEHSGEGVTLRACLTVFADPDGTRLRLHTLEEHGPDLRPDVTNPWLR